jgi:hypothetical protein
MAGRRERPTSVSGLLTARRVVAMGRAPRPGIANQLAVGVLLEFDFSLGYLGCNWLSPGSLTTGVYGTSARLRYTVDFTW